MNEPCNKCEDLEEQVDWYDNKLMEADATISEAFMAITVLKSEIESLYKERERLQSIFDLCYGKNGHDTLTVKTILTAGVECAAQIEPPKRS